MAKQLNVHLSIDADVKRAKAAFEDLQKTLTKIQATAMTSSNNLFNIEDIKKASQAARELQQHLANATDINTGRLNLSSFSNSLKQSGKDLKTYKAELESLGPMGEQAFTKVAKSIATADNPLKKTNGLLKEFKTTLMNTARWQISSSILHGFMGAIQSAYGYAQDLNESLNNIRIVTGYNTEQMAKFAKEANNAAKQLSTTTTAYTDASLIYYQQGLSDSQVKERTDATIKLANVSRQSAEEVSSQMTAIWNNFDDGSKKLEYYEDVITALGASTASSSSEISEGLQKFASVADTVGLSYEKAAASVATVVAETRQSADTVGTAFKTVFARIQGLQLGETLEDGVTLNKYSEALNTVGVNILDSNGKLKEMDTILDELGTKWNSIGENQKVALAETVAGVRQYTQFMALMNNYDKVQSNESIAKSSEGTIQKQADIYAESWEASSKRVKAALETIYQSIINDKFFIGINDTIAVVLEGVNGLISGLGGMKGIISTATAFIGQQLAKEAPAALQRITDYIRQINGKANETGALMQTKTQEWAAEEAPKANKDFEEDNGSAEYMVEVSMIEQLAEKKRQYNENEASYSQQEKARAQEEIAALEESGNALQLKAKKLDELKSKVNETAISLGQMTKSSEGFNKVLELQSIGKASGQLTQLSKNLTILKTRFKEGKISEADYKKELINITNSAKKSGDVIGGSFADRINFLNKHIKTAKFDTDKYAETLQKRLGQGAKQAEKDIDTLKNELSQDFGIPETALNNFIQQLKKIGIESEKIPAVLNNLKQSFSSLKQHTSSTSEQLISFGSALMQINALVSSVTNLKDVFSDEDASAVEKVGAVIGVLTTALFAYNAVAKLTKTLMESESVARLKNAIAAKIQAAAERDKAKAQLEGNAASNAESVSDEINTQEKMKNAGVTQSSTLAKIAHSVATFVETLMTEGLTAALATLETVAFPVLVIALALAAAFASLALIIAGVSAVVGMITDAYNADADAAKNAETAAQDLASAYETCKQKYEDLKSSIEKHQKALNALDSLAKGTREWKEAMIEANDEAMKLINAYQLIQGKDYEIDQDGVIRLKESAMNDLLTEQADKVATMSATSAAANSRAKQARAKSDLTDLKRSQSKFGAEDIALAYAAPPTPITKGLAAIKAGVDIVQDINTNRTIDSAIARLTKGDLSEKFKTNQLSDQELKQTLNINDDELLSSIKSLATTISANTDAVIESNKQLVKQTLQDNETYKLSQHQTEVDSILAKKLSKQSDEIYNNKYKEGQGISNEDLQKKYASAMGYTWSKEDGSKGEYIDQQSGETVSVENEAARQYLAQQDALNTLSADVNKVDQVVEKLSADKDNQASQAILSKLVNGDFSDVKLGTEDVQISEKDLAQFNPEELKTIYENLGYSSVEEFVSGLNKELSEKLVKVDDLVTSLKVSDEAKEAYNKTFNELFSNLTTSEGQNLVNNINKLISSFGDEVGTNFVGMLDEMMKNVTDEEKKFLKQELGKITDFQDAEQWDKFAKAIKNSGQVTEDTKQSFLAYIKTAKDTANAVSSISFDDFTKNMKKAQDTIKNISEGTRTMGKDEYDALIAKGAKESDFIRTLTGDYEYIGSMTSLLGDIEKQTEKDFDKAINNFIQNGEAAAQSADNAGKLADELANMNETSSKSQKKLSEQEKFMMTISSIFEAIVKKIQEVAKAIGDFFGWIWGEIQKGFDNFMGGVNIFLDGIITIWNMFIENVFGALNKLLASFGIKADLGKDLKIETSKEREKREKKEKEQQEAESLSQKNHDNFIKSTNELVPFIQSQGKNTSEKDRKKIEDEIQSRKEEAQRLKTESATKSMDSSLSSTQKDHYEKTEKQAQEELDAIKKVEDAWHQVDIAEMQATTTLASFDSATKKASESGEIDYNIIADKLKDLASNYDNCTEEVLRYNQALASGSSKLVEQEEANLRSAIAVGEMSKALDLTADEVEEQAKQLISVNKLSEENYKVATKVAVLNQSMNKGVSSLVDNWKTYRKTLKTAQKGTEEYAEASLNTKKALSQLLGVLDEDYIPDDFLEIPGVMNLIDKAVKGDEKAINQLGTEMAKATVKAWAWADGMEQAKGKALSASKFKQYKNEVLEGINALTDKIKNGTVKAGEDITNLLNGTGESWINSLNKMAYATGMSVDEMNSLLNELGVEADITTTDKIVKTKVPIYETTEKVTSTGEDKKDNLIRKETSSRIIRYEEMDGAIEVAQINMGKENKGKAPTVTYAGRNNVSSSALKGSSGNSKGGSSGKSKSSSNTSAASHEHEVHRYTNEENKVKGLTDEYNRLVETKDRLYGASRIQAMDAEIKKLEQLKKASKSYLKTIVGSSKQADKVAKILANGGSVGALISRGKLKGTIGKDYKALFQGKSASGKEVEYTAKKGDNEKTVSEHYNLGMLNSMMSKGNKLNIKLDKFGNIKNEDALLKKIQNEKNKENDRYSQIKDPSSKQETDHNRKIAYLDEFKERLSQYKDTASKLNEKGEDYIKQIRAVQDARAEKILAKMNNGVELGQKTQQKLQRSLKVLGDSIYKSVEGMQKWWKNSEKNIKAIKIKGDSYDKALQDTYKLSDKYFKKGGDLNSKVISPAKAAEAYKEIEEGFDTLIDELLSDIETKKGFYGNVMEQWATKISNVDSAIQSNIATLEHYQKTMELLGKSNDYNQMGIILKGQIDASKMNYEGKKAIANTYEKEYIDAKDYYQSLLNSGKKDEADLYYESVFIKAQEKYLQAKSEAESALQSALESVNAFFENEISRIFQESEDRLTGEWSSFDALDKAMKRQQSIAEEYLTKTNQLYETNKMLRTLQKDIDKTDNQIAKTKLRAFSDEINAMQKREKLTKTDLQIAKARYEVLQAQIALEEAQNAKSTVRLQRDNEGNYGYVYTADQNKVSDAEQTLEDKQNALYNIGLEASQKYAEKLVQIRQEYDNAIQELFQKQKDGLITQEEYEMQLADINEKYRELELTYTEEYNSANQVLNEVGAEGQKEAWTSAFSDIIEEHKLFSEDSISEAEILTEALDEKMKWLNEQRAYWTNEAKVGNKDLQDSVNKVTEEVKDLTDEEKNSAAEMGKNLEKANELTKKFVEQYKEMEKLIKKYQKSADEANKYYQKLLKLTQAQKDYNQSIKDQPIPKASSGSRYGGGGDNSNNDGGNSNNQDFSSTPISSAQNTFKSISYDYNAEKGLYQPHVIWINKKGEVKNKNLGIWIGEATDSVVKSKTKYKDFIKEKNIVGGKTGLYTGTWNGLDTEENGKLAFLHQKELVLNTEDTENILAAVQMIRQISQSIDLSALAQSQSLQTSSIRYNGEPQTLQQEVTIHAEFPNATDHNEIEQAFDNLVNRATQYAYRENNNI